MVAVRDRKGQHLSHLSELSKKTAEHAGMPREIVAHIISAFVDVLADEIVTTGGASIPGIASFSTIKAANESALFSRYDMKKRYDVELHVKVSPSLDALHKLHSTFCMENERVITPSTWRDFMARYGRLLRKNSFGIGIMEVNQVRKTGADINTVDKEDFVQIDAPLSVDYFGRLIEQMNATGVFDPAYHVDDKNSLFEGENRLLRLSDLTEETYSYVNNERLEKTARLYDLREQGKINGEYLDNNGRNPLFQGRLS